MTTVEANLDTHIPNICYNPMIKNPKTGHPNISNKESLTPNPNQTNCPSHHFPNRIKVKCRKLKSASNWTIETTTNMSRSRPG